MQYNIKNPFPADTENIPDSLRDNLAIVMCYKIFRETRHFSTEQFKLPNESSVILFE